MRTMQFEDMSEGVSDVIIKRRIKKKENSQNQEKKIKKKKSHFFAYLYLFSFVFLGALWGLSIIIKSYTPSIDVTIGDNEAFTINEADVDTEIKTVDERLKWIQMEDDLPSVSIRNEMRAEKEKKQDKGETKRIKQQDLSDERTVKPPMPTLREIRKQQEEFRNIPAKEVVSTMKPTITKVYLGNYATTEEAASVREKISEIEPTLAPFVKSVKGHYIVQLGSFSDGEKAGALCEKLKAKGYYPKVVYEN